MQESQYLVFGPFQLDRCDERLWRGSEALPLPPKTFCGPVLPCDPGGPAGDQRGTTRCCLARNGGE
jgi:hypothetical protein